MANGTWDQAPTWGYWRITWDDIPTGTTDVQWDTAQQIWGARPENWDELGLFFQSVNHGESFGTMTLDMELVIPSIASAESVGAMYITPGLSVDGIASDEAFGSIITDPSPVYLMGGGIATAEATGTPILDFKIYPESIDQCEFGVARFSINGWSSLAKDSQSWTGQGDDVQSWVDQTKNVSNWS